MQALPEKPKKHHRAAGNPDRVGNNGEHCKDFAMASADQSQDESEDARAERHRRAERCYWIYEKIRGSIALLLTFVAAIGAVVSAVAAIGAWNAATKTVDEAKRQAVATEAQIGVAKDTELRQLRAYLHINHGPLSVSGDTASAELQIFHSGQTPAYKIKLTADIQVAHFPLPDREKLSLPTGGIETHEYGALFGPNPIRQTISMPKGSADAIEIQKRSKDRLAGGVQAFYLFGRVRYQDIFGTEWPYEFCFSFDPADNMQGSEHGCEKYNKPG